MIKKMVIICIVLCCIENTAFCQCSVCNKTIGQMGNGPAQGMNTAIIYLAAAPFLIIAFVYFKWKKNKSKYE